MGRFIAVHIVLALCEAFSVSSEGASPIAGEEAPGQPDIQPEDGFPVAGGADETDPIEQPDPANPADPAEPSGEEPAKEPEKEEPVQAKEPENKQEPTSGQPTQSQNQPQN